MSGTRWVDTVKCIESAFYTLVSDNPPTSPSWPGARTAAVVSRGVARVPRATARQLIGARDTGEALDAVIADGYY